MLWKLLRSRGFEDLKFRRQAPIGRYTVDFCCLEHRLIVELDGGIHDAAVFDIGAQNERDAWLASKGFVVLRFKNNDVGLPHRIFERIRAEVGAGTPHPAPAGPPSPSRGEGNP